MQNRRPILAELARQEMILHPLGAFVGIFYTFVRNKMRMNFKRLISNGITKCSILDQLLHIFQE